MATHYAARNDGFYPLLREYSQRRPNFQTAEEGVGRALSTPVLGPEDFAALLSPAAEAELEAVARRAAGETVRHFGRAVQLFAPLYLGNYCTNRCVYCGFHSGQNIRRRMLSPTEIEAEAAALAATGLRKVLALTGDAPQQTGADYIARAVGTLAGYVPSVGIEVQALTEQEYAEVCRAGADSMTMFQETYNPELYARLHPAGPKRDFAFRLDAPHRAALGGMRGLTLGVLLGLGDWRSDIFMLGMHARWFSRVFPHLELSLSLPRMRPVEAGLPAATGACKTQATPGAKVAAHTERSVGEPLTGVPQAFVPTPVTDRNFVQALIALRCFLPHVGMTLSTRESAFLRDRLLPLGVTRVSAGVCTAVGGYAGNGLEEARRVSGEDGTAERQTADDPVQFVIDDTRSVAEMTADLSRMGFQPVFSDWLLPGSGNLPLTGAQRRGLGGIAAF